MAVNADNLLGLTSPAVETPNASASLSDILKGFITTAGTAAINKEFGETKNTVTNPQAKPPAGNTETYVDTALGEQRANYNALGLTTRQTVIAGGAALAVLLIGAYALTRR